MPRQEENGVGQRMMVEMLVVLPSDISWGPSLMELRSRIFPSTALSAPMTMGDAKDGADRCWQGVWIVMQRLQCQLPLYAPVVLSRCAATPTPWLRRNASRQAPHGAHAVREGFRAQSRFFFTKNKKKASMVHTPRRLKKLFFFQEMS